MHKVDVMIIEMMAGINFNWSKIMRINIGEWLIVAVGGNCHYNIGSVASNGNQMLHQRRTNNKTFFNFTFLLLPSLPPTQEDPIVFVDETFGFVCAFTTSGQPWVWALNSRNNPFADNR